MNNDIAVDAAFRALGLDWRHATVQDVVEASHLARTSWAHRPEAFTELARCAGRFAHAHQYGECLPLDAHAQGPEEAEFEDEGLIDAVDPDPPEAWECAPTRVHRPRTSSPWLWLLVFFAVFWLRVVVARAAG